MAITELLWIALIIYFIIMFIAYKFELKWLFLVGGLLWFIPITQIDNSFIILVSSVMILVHGVLGLYEKKESDF